MTKFFTALRLLLGYPLFYLANRITLRTLASGVFEFLEDWRIVFLRMVGADIGKGSKVRAGLFIVGPKHLRMGINSKIGVHSSLFLYDTFSIGNNVEIGSELLVHTSEHRLDDPQQLLSKQGAVYQPVAIQDNVYIGSRVTILPGVTIENDVVVGAGSVVTKDLPSGYIYGGVPAKAIRKIHKSTT